MAALGGYCLVKVLVLGDPATGKPVTRLQRKRCVAQPRPGFSLSLRVLQILTGGSRTGFSAKISCEIHR